MNDTMRDQCRREAEEAKPWHPELRTVIISEVKSILGWGHEQAFYERAANNLIVHAEVAAVKAYAAALYAERSKRPPTVEGPPMITVEEAISAIDDCDLMIPINDLFKDGQHLTKREYGDVLLKHLKIELRSRLTAAATNTTNDNG